MLILLTRQRRIISLRCPDKWRCVDSGWCEHRKGVQVDQGKESAEGKNSWLGLILLRDEQAGEGWYGDVYG